MGLFRDILQTSFVRYINLVLHMGTGIIIARAYGPDGKGMIVALLLIPQLLVAYGSLGMGESFTYYLSKDKYDFSNFKRMYFSITLILSSFLILLFVVYVQVNTYSDIKYMQILGLSLVPILLMINFLRFAIRGILKIKIYNISLLIESILLIAGVGYTAYNGLDINYIFYSYFLSFSIVVLFLYINFPGSNKKSGTEKVKIKHLLDYGLKSHIYKVLNTTESKFDIFIITLLLTASDVGYYSVAVNLTLIYAMFLQTPVTSIILPYLTNLEKKERIELIMKINRLLFSGGILIGIVLILFGKLLILLIYGDKFLQSYIPMVILIIGITLRTPMATLGYFFKSLGQPEELVKISLITVPLNIILCLLIIPKFGIIGAASVSSFTYSIYFYLLTNKFLKYSGKSYCDVYIAKIPDFHSLKNNLKLQFNSNK